MPTAMRIDRAARYSRRSPDRTLGGGHRPRHCAGRPGAPASQAEPESAQPEDDGGHPARPGGDRRRGVGEGRCRAGRGSAGGAGGQRLLVERKGDKPPSRGRAPRPAAGLRRGRPGRSVEQEQLARRGRSGRGHRRCRVSRIGPQVYAPAGACESAAPAASVRTVLRAGRVSSRSPAASRWASMPTSLERGAGPASASSPTTSCSAATAARSRSPHPGAERRRSHRPPGGDGQWVGGAAGRSTRDDRGVRIAE